MRSAFTPKFADLKIASTLAFFARTAERSSIWVRVQFRLYRGEGILPLREILAFAEMWSKGDQTAPLPVFVPLADGR